ncbi:MAG: sugar ABC transporter ATP-binding protein [Ilumatobacter sp.]|uniref:sugar ABC transporter ATP-binding protein n=1 Tax=Ilumatobacter sp. TaxID=1967498 RepID=UPI00391CE521
MTNLTPARNRADDETSASSAELLVVDDISRNFGPVRALDGVSIHLDRGEVLALAGENGSGKSTLAKIISGVIPASSGSVRLHGQKVQFSGPHDALQAGVALVSQEPTAEPHMTIAENVLLHRLRRPWTIVRKREQVRDAARYLEEVGLDVDPMLPLSALRQGAKELVEVAKALAAEPSVLILDEATTRLPDPEHLFEVVERRCEQHGMAAIIITHRLREIRRLSHRAFVLRDGRPVGELARDDLSDERISSMMVGRELGDFYAKHPYPPGDIALEVRGLVTDRSAHAIDLHVRSGEIVGVAGLVGSGRSELLETIAGCRKPHAGEVVVNGADLKPGSPRAAINAGVSLVPEDRWAQGLVAHDLIVSNLALSRHRTMRRTDRSLDRRKAKQAVADYGVRTQSIHTPVANLSGGNAQKVLLARCLDHEPSVLLLDEPTRGVDIGAKAEIYAIVDRMVAQGVGVVLASSDLMELLGLSDRIVVLHEGEAVGELSRDEATEELIALLSAGGTRS